MGNSVKTQKARAARKPTTHPTKRQAEKSAGEYRPQTTWGRRIWELRKKIIASGQPLLDWEGIELAVAERRG